MSDEGKLPMYLGVKFATLRLSSQGLGTLIIIVFVS